MKDEMFQELLQSVREAGAIMRGEKEPARVFAMEGPDVKAIRSKLGFSQAEFASMMGISVGTLANWEQKRRTPKGPARVLLHVAAAHPELLWEVVRRLDQVGSPVAGETQTEAALVTTS